MEPQPGKKTDAGDGPAVQAIMVIYDNAKADAERIGQLIATVNKHESGTLSGDMKTVLGAYVRFQPHMQKAANWLPNHGGAWVDVEAIHKTILGYGQAIGLDPKTSPLEPDTDKPDAKASDSSAALKSEITAVKAALDSVKAGNVDDVMRINFHLRSLHEIDDERKGSVKAHKPELKQMLKELTEIQKAQPTLADRLAEAHNHLAALLS